MTNGAKMGNIIHEFLPCYFGILNPIVHHENSDRYKLNENQIKTIMCIHHLDRVTPSVVSKIFNIQKGSLTTIIKSLIHLNLISKEFIPHNERSYFLVLTDEGKAFVKYKHDKIEVEFDALFDQMPAHEMDRITEAFHLLSTYLIQKRDLIK